MLINFFALLIIAYSVIGLGELSCVLIGVDPDKEMDRLYEEFGEFEGNYGDWVKGDK